jgi:hypothetical protein
MKDVFDVLFDNGFEEPLANYRDYVVYNTSARGCNPENPFKIDEKEGYVGLEYEVIGWILETARGEECQWQLLKQRLHSQTAEDGSQRQIDELVLSVDGQEESYYFDITVGFSTSVFF